MKLKLDNSKAMRLPHSFFIFMKRTEFHIKEATKNLMKGRTNEFRHCTSLEHN